MEAINNSPKSDNKVFKIFFALFSKLCKLIVEKKIVYRRNEGDK